MEQSLVRLTLNQPAYSRLVVELEALVIRCEEMAAESANPTVLMTRLGTLRQLAAAVNTGAAVATAPEQVAK